MQLEYSSSQIIHAPKDMVSLIELAGRTAYKSHGKMGPGTDEAFCRMLIKSGHHAAIELGGSIHVLFVLPRHITHELVRHRHISALQESTRYVKYTDEQGHAKEITYIIPPWCPNIKPGTMTEQEIYNDDFYYAEQAWLKTLTDSIFVYNYLLNQGWRPEQARGILPHELAAAIHVVANPREWRHIFSLCADKAAHPQMREVMRPLLTKFYLRWPCLFEDIEKRIIGQIMKDD